MRLRFTVLVATILLAAGVLPCAAQQDEPERWHVFGSAGFDFTNTTQSLLQPSGGQESASANTALLGDLRLNGDGFLLDPRFLHLNLSFDGAHGANSTDVGSLHHNGLNYAITSAFLPRSRIPLRVYYANSHFSSSGINLDQNSDDSRLGVQWDLFFSKLPHINLGFERYTSDVRVPTSLSDVSYHQRSWHVGLDDTWKEWKWSLGLGDVGGTSTALGDIGGPQPLVSTNRALDFLTTRSFWQRKANFSLQARDLRRNDQLPGQGSSLSSELTNHAVLSIQHSEKLSSSYSYSFSRVSYESQFAPTSLPGVGNTGLVLPAAINAHTLAAAVNYTLTSWLRFSQQVRYSHMTPFTQTAEAQQSLLEAQPSVSFQKTWHHLDFSARYGPRFQRLTTNLDRAANSFSNSFDGRLNWGDVHLLRLGASARVSRLNLVEQIGGFSQDHQYRFEADTGLLKPLQIHAGVGRVSVELLNLSGRTQQSFTSYDLQLNHRRFALSLAQSLGDGAGALFPGSVRNPDFFIIPLPIGSLIATPLLDRTSRSRSANLVLRLNRRLDLSGSYRSEKNLFQLSQQDYRVVEMRGRYRIGKITVEAGLGNFLTNVEAAQGIAGNRINRYYVRIARDFRLF
jgi:hypothetical protein